jgi:hypothetical protein
MIDLGLRAELTLWAMQGRRPRLWWRDDDAVRDEPQLRRLLDLAGSADVPVALAVIPQRVEPSLRRLLESAQGVSVLQHGSDHLNDGSPDRPTQFAPDRPVQEVAAVIRAGAERLAVLPGRLPIYVPPWNRFEGNVLQALPLAGVDGVSAFGGYAGQEAGLMRCDSHVDLLRWRIAPRFGGAWRCLGRLRRALARRRRSGRWDDPVGLLTHHQVHDEATWAFLEHLLRSQAVRPRVQWCSAEALFFAPS